MTKFTGLCQFSVCLTTSWSQFSQVDKTKMGKLRWNVLQVIISNAIAAITLGLTIGYQEADDYLKDSFTS